MTQAFADSAFDSLRLDAVADQDDRVLGGLDKLDSLSDAVAVSALVGQAVLGRRQRSGNVEVLKDHVARVLDIDRTRRA